MSRRMGRVLLVEDYECVAHALVAVLSEHGLTVERPAGFAPATVLEKAEEFRPDVVLLDFWLGESDSIDLIAPLAGLGFRVAMFTAMDNPIVLGECLERGAVGNISKLQSLEALVDAIDYAVAGRDLISPEKRDGLIAQARASRELEHEQLEAFRDLSPREDEVLRLMMAGHRAADIARSEFIAISTVRTHIASVLDKLGVASQVEAVVRAREFGWPPTIPPPSDTLGPGFRQRARRGRPSGSEGG